MITHSISKLPLVAGQSILHVTKRASGWSFSQFMSAPLQNLGLGVLGMAMVFSASNALFWQTATHPAPMFATSASTAMNVQSSSESIQAPHPLELAVSRAGDLRAISQPQPIVVLPTASTDKVTHEMLVAAQTILTSLEMFSGKVDGFYGPKTAEAIRLFEARFGLSPKGALTPEIINKINTTQLGNLPAVVERPAPAPIAMVQAQPAILVVPKEASIQPTQDIVRSLASQVTLASNIPTPPTASPVITSVNPQVDKALIANIQTGLATLGFYNSSFDGIAGEATAKAIREFENYLSFEMTGLVSHQLQQWLVDAGAYL